MNHGSFYKKNGGEYLFLKSAYSEQLGFLSGWISFLLGFAAPIAAACFAFSSYFSGMLHTEENAHFYGIPMTDIYSVIILVCITLMHSYSHKVSAWFQNVLSSVKVFILLALIIVGLFVDQKTDVSFAMGSHFIDNVWNNAFVVSLFFVAYAYSGWNAAIYIAEEFKDVRKSLPVALVGGTLLVTVLYTLLQYVFLRHSPAGELTGQLNVGTITAQKLLGERMGNLFSLSISLLLISFGWNWNAILFFFGLGVLSILAAVAYTVGKKPYGYAGLGDFSVLIFFGLVGVMGSNYLFTKQVNWIQILPAMSCGFFSMGVLNINNIRDIESDRKAGKYSISDRVCNSPGSL